MVVFPDFWVSLCYRRPTEGALTTNLLSCSLSGASMSAFGTLIRPVLLLALARWTIQSRCRVRLFEEDGHGRHASRLDRSHHHRRSCRLARRTIYEERNGARDE